VSPDRIERWSRRLLWHGFFLFLLGLLTGLLVKGLDNPRMGLSSHLTGLMSGMFLAILGLAGPRLRLRRAGFTATYWLALAGSYANWATTLFAAWTGAGASMPIAAGDLPRAEPWQENVVAAGLWLVAISMIVVSWIVIHGLRGGAAGEHAAGTREDG
jgi:hydroxylaminobenzene mutase